MENKFGTITNDRLVEGYKLDNIPDNMNRTLEQKQNKLIAGTNVKIDYTVPESPVISAIPGANVDYDVLSNRPKLNGKTLEGDRVLDKSDVGLGEVDNTSDVDKPLSAAAIQAIDDLKSLSVQNKACDIPVTTLSAYMQDATSYMRNENLVPKDRDVLYMKFSDLANSIFQVLYMDDGVTGSWNLIRNNGVTDTTGTIKNILYVTALPSNPNVNTLYLIKES